MLWYNTQKKNKDKETKCPMKKKNSLVESEVKVILESYITHKDVSNRGIHKSN